MASNVVVSTKPTMAREEAYRRSGQTMETGFFDAIVRAYANGTHSPCAFIAKMAIYLMIAAELNNTAPFQELQAHVTNNPSDHSVFKLFQTAILYALSALSASPQISMAILLLSVNYLFKPSLRNAMAAVSILVLFSIVPNWTVYEYAIICEMFYLFMVIRNPLYKLFIVGAVFAFIVIDQDLVRHFTKNSKENAGPPPLIRKLFANSSTSAGSTTTPRT